VPLSTGSLRGLVNLRRRGSQRSFGELTRLFPREAAHQNHLRSATVCRNRHFRHDSRVEDDLPVCDDESRFRHQLRTVSEYPLRIFSLAIPFNFADRAVDVCYLLI